MTFVRVYCLLLVVFIYFSFVLAIAQRSVEQHPSVDFKRHTLIKPRLYHGKEKTEISTTKEEGGGHLHHLTVTYDLDGHHNVIDLNLNRDLVPKGYFRKYQQNGSDVVERPTVEEVELCHYKGKIRGKPESWAALSTCDDTVKGVIFDGNDTHYIEKNSLDGEYHYLYRHSDIAETDKKCGYEGDAIHHEDDDGNSRNFSSIHRHKRHVEWIRGPYMANRRSRYVELVLVVDNAVYKEFESDTDKVERYCKDITNIINGLYSQLNIFIALVGVVTWTEKDEISLAENGDITLTNFLHYRRKHLVKTYPNDNAQLITKFAFNNGVISKALKGPICTYEFSGGVNTLHSPVTALVARTIAHAMGHNFGMEHDTNECACPEDSCIMTPSSSLSVPLKHWSNCSIEYLALAFAHGMDYCLRNKPASLFGSPVCGNGFVEPGEECDCGLPEHCDNTCCNATTCLLYASASCATGECCDLETCKPKKAGTLCRSANVECDLPEYCTGQSEYCPTDVYKRDTEICDDGRAYCYHGYCRTRSDQCKLLWGSTGKSSEECYRLNVKGTRHGNCGYDKLSGVFKKCDDEDVLCGLLHCRHNNDRLEFGMESVAILSHSFLNLKGSIIPCRTAIIDLGLSDVDPGLVPDGAKCGDGKMCLNQKCLAVDTLRTNGSKCLNDCNGNGVCDNLGHCHCNDGFTPPSCEYPVLGGSEDSGPASSEGNVTAGSGHSDQLVEQVAADQLVEAIADRLIQKIADQLVQKIADQLIEKIEERLVEKIADRLVEKTIDQLVHKIKEQRETQVVS